jgi:predicted nuclease with TOPRIM domain
LFSIPQGSLPQRSWADNPEAPHEQLLVVQDAIKWVIKNQQELLDKMERVMSNQLRVEEKLQAIRTSILRLSEAFDDWKRKTESEGSMDACNE